MDDVTLTVPRGVVFGLVGENGAGKTTLIKHLLGLLRAQQGLVRVFERDPAADPVGVLSRIGYLSEQRDLPGWMRVEELIRYTRAYYPDWDPEYAERLRQQFGLDASTLVRNLSQGQQAKAGLLVAQAHRPDLLLHDEPSSGLDPIVRRDILEAIIRTVADEGRTVFFSSHLLDEIERVSDFVAMMHQGKLVLCGPLDDIKQGHHRVTLRFDSIQNAPPIMAGALSISGAGKEWTAICNGAQSDLSAAVASLGGRIVDTHMASLDEIFVARVNQTGVGKGAGK